MRGGLSATAAPTFFAALHDHARREYPRECCGVLVDTGAAAPVYVPCRNLAGDSAEFAIAPDDYARAEDLGDIVAICHSHPNASPQPSLADRSMCEITGLPWIIMGYPSGAVHTFRPEGYRAPLIGRTFVHGVHDCYALIRDYYAWELGITLPDFDRAERWWEHGGDLYRDNAEAGGFTRIDIADVQPNDLIIMSVKARVPNHGAVYLGGNIMLQHLMQRLSERVVYGGWYRRITAFALRHKAFL